MNTIRLNRRELNRILELLNLFNDTGDYGYVELMQESDSGIGSVLTAKFIIEHKEVNGEFTVVITDVEHW
jgi:hypothetical protein